MTTSCSENAESCTAIRPSAAPTLKKVETISDAASLFPDSFRPHVVDIRNRLHTHAPVGGGPGRPLLVLHDHPQVHSIWHRVAPKLAEQFTVVLADLRGYGASSEPVSARSRELQQAHDGTGHAEADACAGARSPRCIGTCSRRPRGAPAGHGSSRGHAHSFLSTGTGRRFNDRGPRAPPAVPRPSAAPGTSPAASTAPCAAAPSAWTSAWRWAAWRSRTGPWASCRRRSSR